MLYPQIHVMRYMGNKSKLLDFIIPRLEELAGPGDTVLDLMAGTCSVAYALRNRNRLIVNDCHAYSHAVGLALIENPGRQVSRQSALDDLGRLIPINEQNGVFTFFSLHYADTYFSSTQCRDIDSIRYAAGQVPDQYKRALYLSALIFAMCYAQSSTGHFAQYLPREHPRLQALRKIDIKEAFFRKCDEMVISPTAYRNRSLHLEAADCLTSVREEGVRLVYLDPPYSSAQYSRFYHLLETVVLYDHPKLSYKGLYRSNRYRSPFSYDRKAAKAFASLITRTSRELGARLAISYSDRALVPLNDLLALCRSAYRHVDTAVHPHPHSTQGKGATKVNEVLIICS